MPVSPIAIDHAVSGPPQGHWTVADWEQLPADGYRYEIIAGMLYMTTAPSNFHQWIIQQFVERVGLPARQQQQAFYFVAPIGVLLGPRVAVQPDFVLVRQARAGIIRGGRIRGAPDLVVEVLSPGNTSHEQETKYQAYAAGGVAEYGMVDPRSRTLHYHQLQASGSYGAAQRFGEGEQVQFAAVPGVVLAVADLFAGAPDTSLEIEP
jgi:Uma2 family endonuclease